MADDWVTQYIQRLEHRREEEAAQRQKAKWAEDQAGAVFGQLRRRLKQDVEGFSGAAGVGTVTYAETPSGEVMIRKASYPSATLQIEVRGMVIRCEYTLTHDDISRPEQSDISLRIAADNSGSVQIYRNGAPFMGDAEVSELILTKVFDFTTQ